MSNVGFLARGMGGQMREWPGCDGVRWTRWNVGGDGCGLWRGLTLDPSRRSLAQDDKAGRRDWRGGDVGGERGASTLLGRREETGEGRAVDGHRQRIWWAGESEKLQGRYVQYMA
jgi:hypothetical protein